MYEEINGINTTHKVGNRWVIYENDYGTLGGKGYALLYSDEDPGFYERYHIKRYVKDGILYQEPDLSKPYPYPDGTNVIKI